MAMKSVFALVLSLLAVNTAFSLPPFHALNQHPPVDSPQPSNYRSACSVEDVLAAVDMDDLQDIIERMALQSGVAPHAILKKLQRKLKAKDEADDNRLNFVGNHPPPPPGFFGRPDMAPPPVMRLPPEPNQPSYYLPDGHQDAQVFFVPVAPPADNAHRATSNAGPMANEVKPRMFVSQRSSHPKPLMGATIGVVTSDPLSPLGREVTIAVSPMMTLVEALRQAEIKLQNAMGLAPDADVFTFAHSAASNCFVVDNVRDEARDGGLGWKVTMTNRDGKVVYDGNCLPTGTEATVKPGMVITLSRVPAVLE